MKIPVDEHPVLTPGTPTQVANPKRASWRTFLQAVIPTLIVVNVALPIIQQFLVDNVDDAGQVLGPAYGWIVAAVNFIVLVLGLVSKLFAVLMANPTVNGWITRHLPALAPIRQVDANSHPSAVVQGTRR